MDILRKIIGPALGLLLLVTIVQGQVPQLINYQGRIAVGSVNFDGSGAFRFALVDAAGTTTFWSNDGTSVAGSLPANAVTLPVSKGLYSVLLGDPSLVHMTPIPSSVFANPEVGLRVWFDDGVNGAQLLVPDQRIAAVGYAMVAANVPNGAITSAKIAPGAITEILLAPGAAAANLAASNQSNLIEPNAETWGGANLCVVRRFPFNRRSHGLDDSSGQ